jgi:hypothetical protein
MAIRPQHTVRMDELTWNEFGDIARAAGTDRATLLRQFVLWYVRRGTLPPRPSEGVVPTSGFEVNEGGGHTLAVIVSAQRNQHQSHQGKEDRRRRE